MKIVNYNKVHIKSVLIVAIFIALLGGFTACDLSYPPAPTTAPAQPAPAKATAAFISTRDAAMLAVYQHLLDQAESFEAKVYLADFYTTCDNWSAESEFFKDGSGTWSVVVDMTGRKADLPEPHWRQAGWLVFKDGRVTPSNRFQANALRIEADLQELSTKTGTDTSQLPETKT